MTILITGANGFIGGALSTSMKAAGLTVRRAVRATGGDVAVGDIGPQTDWRAALAGIEVVVHLAARVHVLQETATDPLAAFREVNTAGTLRLAGAAAEAGVGRLVFVSTIGVNGQQTPPGVAFREGDTPNPTLPYAESKWEAEQGLWDLSTETNLDVVIVRPPLVYGPNAPGNFGRIVKLVRSGLPLPLGATNNRRSMVSVDNLASFLTTCAEHPAAANETFLISDQDDLSTTALVQKIGAVLGKSPLLLPVPEGVVRLPARIVGKERLVDQLWGSLAIDASKATDHLGWQAIVSVDEGLRRAVAQEV